MFIFSRLVLENYERTLENMFSRARFLDAKNNSVCDDDFFNSKYSYDKSQVIVLFVDDSESNNFLMWKALSVVCTFCLFHIKLSTFVISNV